MYLTLPIFLVSIVVLQQTIHVQSLVSPIQSPDNEAGRPNIARRLRAPLMGRSLLSISAADEDSLHLANHESGSNSASDDEQFVLLKKRRYGAPLFGRRGIQAKRRGPLFG